MDMPPMPAPPPKDAPRGRLAAAWSALRIPPVHLPVHALLVIYYLYALWRYHQTPQEYSTVFWFIHGVMHEVGHAAASFLPETIHVLAGSLLQWLTPIACGVYFLRSTERHAVFLSLAWLGFSLLDSAAYMRDAIEQELQLVAPFAGPDTELIHDWAFLFSQWGCLHSAHAIGNAVSAIGYFTVILAVILTVAAAFPRWTKNT